MAIEEQQYPDMQAAAHALAELLGADLKNAVAKKGQASLAVSGGRTPKLVFEKLRQLEIDWSKVTITLIDERWVAPDHPDSNEGLTRNYLMQGAAKEAVFVPMYGGEDTPMSGQENCEKRLQDMSLPFDAAYLGMGPDGHFASLFPGDPAVHVTEGRCVGVPATGDRVARMSLTAPTVMNSTTVYLLFSGADKHEKYAQAKTDGTVEEIPLRLVLRQNDTNVKVLMAP
ncbi:MAG: 6-phosphogluconolactonase [Calditrichia bacterium]